MGIFYYIRCICILFGYEIVKTKKRANLNSTEVEKMNFIDKAFDNKLHGDDFLQAMNDIYSETEVREILDKYPTFVKDVILIIDYDTEIQMEGLDEVIHGNLEEQLPEIVQSLDNCGEKG